MKEIKTHNAPIPAGHYSQAMVYGGLVYISGQLPIDPFSGEKITGTVEDQAEQVLKNLEAILDAAGSSLDHVLKVNVYLSDIEDWGKVNEVYSLVFGSHKPARAVIPVRELHFGFRIEVDAIAALAEGV